jgi:phosphatidate cytidylyltransferase
VLIPAVLAAVWYGGGVYLLVIAIAIGLMAVEWAKMSAPEAPAEVAVTITVAVLTGVFAAYQGLYPAAWLLMVGGGVAAAVASRHRTERAADAGYGVFYIAPACIILVWLRQSSTGEFVWPLDEGTAWTVALFSITWAADIGAYAVGRIAGGPKLWPRISPNKTWSGFFGGLVAATLVGAALYRLLPALELGLLQASVIGLIGGAATMVGDLWESMLKRRFGVKDSGDIIPGHGGIIDRVDGLMFAAIAVALCRVAPEWLP